MGLEGPSGETYTTYASLGKERNEIFTLTRVAQPTFWSSLVGFFCPNEQLYCSRMISFSLLLLSLTM